MVIDHVDRIELADDQVQAHANELNSLRYLAGGLYFLHAQVKGIEEKITTQVGPKQRVTFFGNAPEFEWVPQGLVACAFHWYALSACNYVRMVGWLGNDGDSKRATEYVQRVMPSVYIWRNKVAAHFARTDPRPEDTAADLAASVIFPVSFHENAFYANSWTVGLGRGSQRTTSRQNMTWSLTNTHFGLCERYWPDSLPDGRTRP